MGYPQIHLSDFVSTLVVLRKRGGGGVSTNTHFIFCLHTCSLAWRSGGGGGEGGYLQIHISDFVCTLVVLRKGVGVGYPQIHISDFVCIPVVWRVVGVLGLIAAKIELGFFFFFFCCCCCCCCCCCLFCLIATKTEAAFFFFF